MIICADFLGYMFLSIIVSFLVGFTINGVFSIFENVR